jgi:hypothetical protein
LQLISLGRIGRRFHAGLLGLKNLPNCLSPSFR